ncbi:MAG: ATP-binding protein [Actinomycetia bacterium]|nr:ATP-binding protein [Actinomycetes bacterium]
MQSDLQARGYIVPSYRHRELPIAVKAALETLPIVVITGMRQTGKTTMIVNDPLLDERAYISLSDLALLAAARENPQVMIEEYERVAIDEAQRAPGLFSAIKQSVESNMTPGRFLLSGSASFDISRETGESFGGRAMYYRLPPMSRREISGNIDEEPFLVSFMSSQGLPGKKDIDPISNEEVLAGGMPPVVLFPEIDRDIWFTAFERTYYERDLLDITRVQNILGFRNMLRLVAQRTGQTINIAGIGGDLQLNSTTAYRYVGLMERSFVLNLVSPFLRSKTSRLRKAPKAFIADSGLACHLVGCHDLRDHHLRGGLYETYVAQNLLNIVESHMHGAELLHWRTAGGKEVDLVVEHNKTSTVIGIEVKAASTWRSGDLNGLKAFMEEYPECDAGILAYNGVESMKVDEKLWVIPIGVLIS